MIDRNIVLQKLKNNAILSWEEMQYLQQNPLTDLEAFIMFEDDSEKIVQYEHYYNLKKDLNNGTLTEQQLKGLIDTLFSNGQKQDEIFNSNTLYEELKSKL